LLFEAEAHVSESGGESGGGVVVEKVVGDSETKLGLIGDAEADGCFGEIEGALVCGASLRNPFSNCRLPQGTTMLELVICGRSVEMGVCVFVPQVWAFAGNARMPPTTKRKNADVRRGIQTMIAAGLVTRALLVEGGLTGGDERGRWVGSMPYETKTLESS
jgi:hypothetical protein